MWEIIPITTKTGNTHKNKAKITGAKIRSRRKVKNQPTVSAQSSQMFRNVFM